MGSLDWDWQTLASLSLVALAVGYLMRRGWRSLAGGRSSGCGSCSSCPAGSPPEERTLVAIDLPDPRPRDGDKSL